MVWTDELKATNAREMKDRAQVDVSMTMKFKTGATYTSTFTEGYLKNKDGSAGARFYVANGQTTIYQRLHSDTWSFETVPTNQELIALGMDPAHVIGAKHTTVKTTVRAKTEIHTISRVTAVQLKTSKGPQLIQFVSLQGRHVRQ